MPEDNNINKFENPHYAKREVTGPDGEVFTVDPMRDYFSDARPQVHEPNSIPVIVNNLCAGGSYSIFLDSDGSLWTWGRNQYGVLGE